MEVKANHMPLVRINAPELYADPEFVAWLNNDDERPVTGPATWHTRGELPGEYSDIFFTVDPPDGSDSDMPTACWDKILDAVADVLGPHRECLVWLSNLAEEDKTQLDPRTIAAG